VIIVVAMLVADVVAVWLFRMAAAPAEQLAKADRISLAVIRVHFGIDTFHESLRHRSGHSQAIAVWFLILRRRPLSRSVISNPIVAAVVVGAKARRRPGRPPFGLHPTKRLTQFLPAPGG